MLMKSMQKNSTGIPIAGFLVLTQEDPGFVLCVSFAQKFPVQCRDTS